MATKLLFDIEQLLLSKGKETGICRVSMELLRRICACPKYDVYPLVTNGKCADAKEYLIGKGLDDLVKKVVYMPYLKGTTKNYSCYKSFLSWCRTLKYKKQCLQQLKAYDEYISIFSPISPIVYQSNVKTKIIVHDLIPVKFAQFAAKKFADKYKHWMKAIKADEVFCDSKSTRNDFLAFRPDYDENKVKVAYLAADGFKSKNIKRSVKKKYGIKTKNYILSVSDHNPRKNFEHLIEAFARFLEMHPQEDISLVIVGPETANTKNIVKKSEHCKLLAGHFVMTGFVSDDDIYSLYKNAEMFIYPSLYEGFGLPVLEAMIAGVATIVANNSSLPEVAGEAALYISGKDIEQTAKAIAALHEDKQKRIMLSEAGLVQAEKFSWDKTTQTIFNLTVKE